MVFHLSLESEIDSKNENCRNRSNLQTCYVNNSGNYCDCYKNANDYFGENFYEIDCSFLNDLNCNVSYNFYSVILIKYSTPNDFDSPYGYDLVFCLSFYLVYRLWA